MTSRAKQVVKVVANAFGWFVNTEQRSGSQRYNTDGKVDPARFRDKLQAAMAANSCLDNLGVVGTGAFEDGEVVFDDGSRLRYRITGDNSRLEEV